MISEVENKCIERAMVAIAKEGSINKEKSRRGIEKIVEK
jgi:hypothetical protein